MPGLKIRFLCSGVERIQAQLFITKFEKFMNELYFDGKTLKMSAFSRSITVDSLHVQGGYFTLNIGCVTSMTLSNSHRTRLSQSQ